MKAGDEMNLLHMKYALEVAKMGSLYKASEKLLVAVPNISRSIKELEADCNHFDFYGGSECLLCSGR